VDPSIDIGSLAARDICSEYITRTIVDAGRDLYTQIRKEVSFIKGRIIVRGKLHTSANKSALTTCSNSRKIFK
jgi:type I restriction enzyme R subunit